jgi:hypothetical protein
MWHCYTCAMTEIFTKPRSLTILVQFVCFPFPTSRQYFSLICDPLTDPIISLHSRDISFRLPHLNIATGPKK